MKKSKRSLQILGIVLILSTVFLGVSYPFGGDSILNRTWYTFIHKNLLHLSDDYNYKVIQYHSLNEFDSYAIIEFDSENDLDNLKLNYANDANIKQYDSLSDSESKMIFDKYLNYLPININCGCYTFFAINENQFTSGYLYHVFIIENKIYVYYASR